MNGVDDKRAVMFGGTARDLPRSDELYIIHWDSMVGSGRRIARGAPVMPGSPPWPPSRDHHVCTAGIHCLLVGCQARHSLSVCLPSRLALVSLPEKYVIVKFPNECR